MWQRPQLLRLQGGAEIPHHKEGQRVGLCSETHPVTPCAGDASSERNPDPANLINPLLSCCTFPSALARLSPRIPQTSTLPETSPERHPLQVSPSSRRNENLSGGVGGEGVNETFFALRNLSSGVQGEALGQCLRDPTPFIHNVGQAADTMLGSSDSLSAISPRMDLSV